MSIAQRLTHLLSSVTFRGKQQQKETSLSASDTTEGQLRIPCVPYVAGEREQHKWLDLGQRLARQEDWEALSRHLHDADNDRQATEGGDNVAELLTRGAQEDVLSVVEDALAPGQPEHDAPLLAGIEALEAVLEEFPDDYAIAVIVAATHVEMASLWMAVGSEVRDPEVNDEASRAHMDRAEEILSPFIQGGCTALSLHVLSNRITTHTAETVDELTRGFGRLIDMDSTDHRHITHFGSQLLQHFPGSYSQLTQEAQVLCERLKESWGEGAYVWVMLDVIRRDPEAMAGLDVEWFIRGLTKILKSAPKQQVVNTLAAFCALLDADASREDAASYNRSKLHQCHIWIVKDYLSQLHPAIWAQQVSAMRDAQGEPTEDPTIDGREIAMEVLRNVFVVELSLGVNVAFTRDGVIKGRSLRQT